MLDPLIDLHERIGAVIERAIPELERATPDLATLLAIRVEMAGLIAAHSQFVHRTMFTPLRERGTAAEVHIAQLLDHKCARLSAQLRNHADTWSERELAADWSGYRARSKLLAASMLAAVRDVIGLARALEGAVTPVVI